MQAQIYKIKIESLAHDGAGIGFLPGNGRGKAVFVNGALPGQTVECALQADKGSFCRATLLGVTDSTLELNKPLCSHFAECGGCPLQLAPYQTQLAWKQNLARNALQRLGHIPEPRINAIWQKTAASPQLQNYRNRVQLAFGHDEQGNLNLGFRKQSSHSVFALKDCAIIADAALQMSQFFQDIAGMTNLPAFDGKTGFWRFFILRKSGNSTREAIWKALCITSPGSKKDYAQVRAAGQSLLQTCPGLTGFIHEIRAARDFIALGQKRILCLDQNGAENPEAAELAMSVANTTFKLDSASFFQVNSAANELLTQKIIEFSQQTGKTSLLDLYCGSGSPGLLLAQAKQNYTGLEVDQRAIRYAKINAVSQGVKNSALICANAARIPAKVKSGKYAAILADPPRSGLSGDSLELVLDSGADSLLYVSCNPVTLARDASLLAAKYELDELASVDMFPHTPHLECVGFWRKKAGIKS